MSAGLILPEGRELDSVLQTAISLPSERERGREGGEDRGSTRQFKDDLCPAVQTQK